LSRRLRGQATRQAAEAADALAGEAFVRNTRDGFRGKEFKMKMVNRAAFIITPKEPYIEWAGSIDADSAAAVKGIVGEHTIYLASDDIIDGSDPPLIEDHFSRIFDQELEAWSLDESTWPKRRDRETFERWFDVVLVSSVFDLSKGRISAVDADF
jgi:hypothetical protein